MARLKSKKLAAGLLAVTALAGGAVPAAAFANPPKFNPGQKGNVCDAPGPNSNPHCVPD